MAVLRPILEAVYERDREEFSPASVLDVLADVSSEQLASLLAADTVQHEEVARKQVLEAVSALVEDAVCRLRAKSSRAVELEEEHAKESAVWREREPSWRARAVYGAMNLPRGLPDVPATLFWSAAMIKACETSVRDHGASRNVAWALLRSLAELERLVDLSISALEKRGKKHRAAPAPAAPDLDNPHLSYCPPDPRRIDPEILLIARKVIADPGRGSPLDIRARATPAVRDATSVPLPTPKFNEFRDVVTRPADAPLEAENSQPKTTMTESPPGGPEQTTQPNESQPMANEEWKAHDPAVSGPIRSGSGRTSPFGAGGRGDTDIPDLASGPAPSAVSPEPDVDEEVKALVRDVR
jgi:hypothetical protein